MDSWTTEVVSKGLVPTQSSHVLCGSSDGPASDDSTYCHDWIESDLASNFLCSGNGSYKPDINPVGEGLTEACIKDDANEHCPFGNCHVSSVPNRMPALQRKKRYGSNLLIIFVACWRNILTDGNQLKRLEVQSSYAQK